MPKQKKRDATARGTLREVLTRYRITTGEGFDLDRFAPDDAPEKGLKKSDAEAILEAQKQTLAPLQELVYANGTWAVLLIFQAMDAAGKDSTIKAVASGINPQGVPVTSFKAPGPEDLAHDFLRRVSRALPARGMIGVFNRSHYEDVLAPRVHADLLAKQKLPPDLAAQQEIWDARIGDIANYEAYLGRQGIRIAKFFLDVSRDEQRKRLLARVDEPEKNWKFDPADLRERELWPRYRTAYQAAIRGTATPAAPWYVIPADRKWYTHLLVAEAIVETLESLGLQSPKPKISKDDLAAARRELASE